MLTNRIVNNLGKVLVRPLSSGKAHQSEARRKKSAVCEVVNGRHEFFSGKVACDSKDYERARTSDAIETTVVRIAKRIVTSGQLCRTQAILLKTV
jgi:hypothetical protein